jgi:hypothetical protein
MALLPFRCPPLATTAGRAALLLFALAGCSELTIPVNPGSVLEVSVDSAAGPIARTLTVRLDMPAPIEVTWGAPGTPVLTVAADSFSLEHRIVLPRLRAGRTYEAEASVLNGTTQVVRTTFHTGPLPAEVAGIDLDVTGSPTVPVALVEIAGSTGFTGFLMVEEGEVVGYVPVNGSLFGMTRRADGDLVLLHPAEGLLVHRVDGTVVHRLPQSGDEAPASYGTIHHDLTATPANTILFIANETKDVNGETVVGEALWEWDPEAGTVRQRWSAFDHLDWATLRGARTVAGNWLHGNGISYGPRGNVLMSLRNVDQVISIAPDFSRVEWSLGGTNGTLAIADADRFYGQHYVTEPAPGRVLLFDNGYERPTGGLFSRAIEFAIDTRRGTATRVWEYRHSPGIYAALVGSARRLPNGNTTVLFGMLQGHNQSTGPLTAVEVTPDGTVAWRLTVGPLLTRLYRVTPVESLTGERPGSFRGS